MSFVRRVFYLFFWVVPVTSSADSTVNAVPALIQVGANGYVRFTLVGGGTMCGGAVSGPTSMGDIQVGQGGVTADGQKAMLILLMSAKLSGKAVKVYASNGSASQFGCLVTGVELP